MRFLWKNKADSPWKIFAGYLAVFLACAAVFTFVQFEPSFRDPDSFYHMKMTMLMAERGLITDFTWLPFTTLAAAFTDHHLLYHLALIPFFALLGPLMGMKVASIVFSAAAVTAFYGLLRVNGVRWPSPYSLLLATSSGFLFRVNLAKATGLSLTLIMLALIAIRKKKVLPLLILSWMYVLLHGGWPIIIVIVGVSLGTKAVIDKMAERHPWHSWASLWFWKRLLRGSRAAWQDLWETVEVRQAAAAGGGVVAGLVINPYFPTNMRFYWEQIVQIAVVNYQGKIGVGSEWYPYPPLELYGASSMVFLLFTIGLAILAAGLLWNDIYRGSGRATRPQIAALCSSFLLAVFFLCMTLRSQRHVEYFVPFAFLFDALLIDLLLTHIDPRKALRKISGVVRKPIILEFIIVGYFAFVIPFMAVRDVLSVRKSFNGGVPWTKYERASAWLAENTKEGSIIVHSDWDDFPVLFFRDDRNRYICGLDPTFCYRGDQDRYWTWVRLTTGQIRTGMGTVMKEKFGSSFALIEKDHYLMRDAAAIDPTLHLVYDDEEVAIYTAL